MGTAASQGIDADWIAPVRTINAQGRGPYAIVCDHASNRIPPAYGDLGLPPSERIRHIAWDPGALAVATWLSEALDSPLVHSTVSRLVVDCNRFTDSDTLIAEISEHTTVPGNIGISPAERAARISLYHAPYHAAIDRLLEARQQAGLASILVCVHSFTPVFKGFTRPWPIGVLPPIDETFSAALLDALKLELPGMNIGWNQPYAGGSGVSYTVDHHGAQIPATMIELRHDEILEPAGVTLWADRLARCLEAARGALHGAPAPISLPRRGGIGLEGRD